MKIDKRRAAFVLICVFGLIEALLWVDILWLGVYTVAAEYTSIVLAFAVSLVFIGKKPENYTIQTGLLFTCAADFFLVISDPVEKEPAMTAFLITQTAYCAFICFNGGKIFNIVHLVLRLFLSAVIVIVTAAIVKDKFDYLSAVSMIYYVNLIINAVCALCLFKRMPFFGIGLILFILCDTVIGLNVAIGSYIFADESSLLFIISHSPFNWAWAFYLPSQFFIAVSAAVGRIKSEKRA